MPLNIKDERAHDLARQLADQTGESLTRAVVIALEERLQRMALAARENSLARDLNRMALEISSMPSKDNRSLEEILGYDENGLPT